MDGQVIVFDTVHIGDIQSNVVVSDATGKITGKLSYVWDGPLVDKWGAGYFIGLDFSQNNFEGLTSVKVGLDPSVSSGLVELLVDPDHNGVFKITDNEHQKFVVEQTDGTFTMRQEWDLFALELLEPDPIDPITSLSVPLDAADVLDGNWVEEGDPNVKASSLQSNVVFTYNSSTKNFTVTGTLLEQAEDSTVAKWMGKGQGYWLALDMSQFDSSFAASEHIDFVEFEVFDTNDELVGHGYYEPGNTSAEPQINPYIVIDIIDSDNAANLGYMQMLQARSDETMLTQTIDLSGLTLD